MRVEAAAPRPGPAGAFVLGVALALLAFASAVAPLAATAMAAGIDVALDVALEDASADRVHAVVPVPDANRRVGVVRLLSRGNAVVVQTLLDTRLLSRAVAGIRAKERRAWGDADAASASYLAALESALATVESRPADDERRRRLLIEFAADDRAAAVFVGTFASFDDRTMAHPPSREVMARLSPPREWVLCEIRLVVADAFDVPEAEVDRVGPLGPASPLAPPPTPPPTSPPAPPPASPPASPPANPGPASATPVPVPGGEAR